MICPKEEFPVKKLLSVKKDTTKVRGWACPGSQFICQAKIFSEAIPFGLRLDSI